MAEPARSRSVWDEILGELQKQVNLHSYNTWLRPTRMERLENGVLYVSVPSADFARAGEKFGPQIERAIARLNLPGVARVCFAPPAPPAAPAAAPPGRDPRAAAPRQRPLDFESVANTLNPRYTFESFVVGGSNEFAHAAAQAVADRPGKAYNPLFLYGGTGMGKTHLMQAVGHAVGRSAPRLRIAYLTAERFVNEMVGALVNNQTIAFRDRYRSIDVLLVDDIQFIINKERMQEEFFHTFNALHGEEKQIVLSSDRPPKDLPTLEERLRSRFEWGLITDLQPPDLETRIAILMRKARMEQASHGPAPDLTPEVAEFVAGKVKSNVRELEGALVRLLAYCSVKKLPVTIPVAQEALRHIIDQQQRKVDIETIAQTVAERFSLRAPDLKTRNNSRRIVYPRQIAMYMAKQLTDASLPEIARFFGGKHHSTVIHSIRKIEARRRADGELDRALLYFKERLG